MAVKAKVRAAQHEQRGRAWLAWHTALLPLMKQFPKLSDLTGTVAKAPPRQQTAAEIEAAGLRWHYALNARKGPAKT